jgi:hypothetical protein
MSILERLEQSGMQAYELTFEDVLEEREDRKAARQAARANPEAPKPHRIAESRPHLARLSRMVRDTVMMRAKLAAGILPRDRSQDENSSGASLPKKPVDPRERHVCDFLVDIILKTPHVAVDRAVHQQIPILVKEHLESDPEFEHSGSEIVAAICDQFKIPYDLAQMSNDLIFPINHPERKARPHAFDHGHDPPPP